VDRGGKGKGKRKGKPLMQKQDIRCKLQKAWLLSFGFWLLTSAVSTPLYASNKPITGGDEPAVAEHVIKIEGSLEKPRVIFIVPRAKLWRDDIFKKSFISDILKPVYPKLSIKEGGPDKDSRR
jgi:hypothetical protein